MGHAARLLDVGCGWGSLVTHAARYFGVSATGVTISAAQRSFVESRVAELGLSSLVTVRLADYRTLEGEPYDAVASIEMGEHVGERNYPACAAVLRRMVRPGGRVLVQQMSRGGVAPGGGAFIESYIAPDMTMRPLAATLGHVATAGLEVRDVQALREHYVRTIDAWARRLEERWSSVVDVVGEG